MKDFILFAVIGTCLTSLWFTRNDPSFAIGKLDYMNRICKEHKFTVTKAGFKCGTKYYKWRE